MVYVCGVMGRVDRDVCESTSWTLLVSAVGRRSAPGTWRFLGGWSAQRFRLRGNRSRRRSIWLRPGRRRHRCTRTSLRWLGRRSRNQRSSRTRWPGRRCRSRSRIWITHGSNHVITLYIAYAVALPVYESTGLLTRIWSFRRSSLLAIA